MKANLPKAVFAIQSLIDTNNERFEYYKEAASSCKEMELKLFFMKYAIQSQSFTTYLTSWLSAYGAVNTPSPRKNELLNKVWNQLKRSVTLNERSLVLKDAERIEKTAIKKYRTSLALSFFPAEAESDIKKQVLELESGFQNLQEMKQSFSRSWQVA